MGEDAPLFEVLATMRAMRRLRPDPVPDELLTRLGEAATWAPSGANAQAHSFVALTDRAVMARLADLWRRCVELYFASVGGRTPSTMDDPGYARMREAIEYQRDHFHETPAVIVPCYAYPRGGASVAGALARQLSAGEFARLGARMGRFAALREGSSISPGVQNLLLAARALGLAANITIWHLFLEHEWKAVLGIPRRVNTFAVIPVGWPLGRFGPVRRQAPEDAIHRDRW